MWRRRRPRSTGGPDTNSGKSGVLGDAGLGQFDGDPQINLRENLVNPTVSRPVVKVGGHGFKPEHRGLIEGPGKQPKLELVKSVERPPAVLDGAAPAFDRVFDTLKRDQRVDSAQSTQRDGCGLRVGSVPFPDRKSAPDVRRTALGAVANDVPLGPWTRIRNMVSPYG